MNYKVIALDDNEDSLDILRMEAKIHNKHSANKVELQAFSDVSSFISAVTDSHDLIMIDIQLDHEKMNGFDITKILAKKHPDAIFLMFSNMVKASETMRSFIPKSKLKWSEIINRLNILKLKPYDNIFDIMMSRSRYYCA